MSGEVKLDRGITVGLSWPRPATPCNLVPRWEGEFANHGDWVSFASKRLTVAHDSNGNQLKAICVDKFGRRCANGKDFQRAHDEDAFPVRYFWDCEPPSSALQTHADAMCSLLDEAFTELGGIDDQADLRARIMAAQADYREFKGHE